MRKEITVGDLVSASPVGSGKVTGFSDRGYPQVNHVTVTWIEFTNGDFFDARECFLADPDRARHDSAKAEKKLAALPQPAAVPSGWRLVPVEPTAAMEWAWNRADTTFSDGYRRVRHAGHTEWKLRYAAMLTAASPEDKLDPGIIDERAWPFREPL